MTKIVNPELYKLVFDAVKENTYADDLGDGSGDYVVSTEEIEGDPELQAFLANLNIPQIARAEVEGDGWV